MSDTAKQIIVALVLVYFLNKTLQGIGLTTSAEAEKAESNFSITSPDLAVRTLFKPDSGEFNISGATKAKLDAVTYPKQAAGTYDAAINKILGAKKLVNDQEGKIYEAFSVIGSLEELKVFVWLFRQYVEENPIEIITYYLESPDEIKILGTYLLSFMNANDLLKLTNQLKKLKHI